MALDQSALLELLAQLELTDVPDRIRAATESLYQQLIEADATAFIGAAPFERSEARTTQRNCSRPRTLTTTAGDLNLSIPKLRQGSFFPALLERRRRVDQALYAVVMEAYLHGVLTRKVDDLVKAVSADTGISKSEVSRVCEDLDHEVGAFRDRDLSALEFPYVFLDATYCKARVNHRVVSQAVVVAFGVAADGRREVLGFDVGDSENEAFWTTFLRSLKARSLSGVKLVISDAHDDLLAFAGFPPKHWRQNWSTNPMERVNKEIKRRTDVVGVFPNPAVLLRLAGAVLVEQHDELEAGDRRYLSEASMAQLYAMDTATADTVEEVISLPELIAA